MKSLRALELCRLFSVWLDAAGDSLGFGILHDFAGRFAIANEHRDCCDLCVVPRSVIVFFVAFVLALGIISQPVEILLHPGDDRSLILFRPGPRLAQEHNSIADANEMTRIENSRA